MEFAPNESDDEGYVSPVFDLSHLSSDDEEEKRYNPNKVSKHKKQRTAVGPSEVDLEALALRALGR